MPVFIVESRSCRERGALGVFGMHRRDIAAPTQVDAEDEFRTMFECNAAPLARPQHVVVIEDETERHIVYESKRNALVSAAAAAEVTEDEEEEVLRLYRQGPRKHIHDLGGEGG